jgi:hypothetical protein
MNQCWEWISIEDVESNRATIETLSTILNLPIQYIIQQRGAWLVNITKNKNCDKEEKKSQSEIASINKQIDMMIDTKYKFIHYNGLTKRYFNELTNNLEVNIFDNSAIVIDEAHNFISRIVNKISKMSKKKGTSSIQSLPLSLIMYDMLMSAQNCKIVLLSGTPIINYPNEIGILFNILRGYINTWNIEIQSSGPLSKDKLEKLLLSNQGITDYIDYDNIILSKLIQIIIIKKNDDKYELNIIKTQCQ